MRQIISKSVSQTVIVLLPFCSWGVQAQDVPVDSVETRSGYTTIDDETHSNPIPSSDSPLTYSADEKNRAPTGPLNSSPSPLAGRLADRLGITPDQGAAGASSIFRYAKQKMNPEDFRKIHDLVPDLDEIINGGPAAGISSLSDDLTDTESKDPELVTILLKNDFDQFGLAPDMLGKFVPVIVEYIKSQGGESAANLLQNALAGI